MSNATPEDRGSAMVITLMVLALVTALSTTVAVVTINDLQGSRRAQAAGAALGAADAGVAQAISYLRNSGVRDLTCTRAAPASADCAKPWGSANPEFLLDAVAISDSCEVESGVAGRHAAKVGFAVLVAPAAS